MNRRGVNPTLLNTIPCSKAVTTLDASFGTTFVPGVIPDGVNNILTFEVPIPVKKNVTIYGNNEVGVTGLKRYLILIRMNLTSSDGTPATMGMRLTEYKNGVQVGLPSFDIMENVSFVNNTAVFSTSSMATEQTPGIETRISVYVNGTNVSLVYGSLSIQTIG